MAKEEQRILVVRGMISGVNRKEATDIALELAARGVEAINEATGASTTGIVEDLNTGKELGRVYPEVRRGKQLFYLSASQYERIFGEKKAG